MLLSDHETILDSDSILTNEIIPKTMAVIGAGAVVTKTVPAYALVVGNPARQLGWMSEYGHRLEFDNNGIAICQESNEKYRLENQTVSKIEE